MESNKICSGYLNENNISVVVEYRGNFKEEMDKIDYACGDIITNTLAIVSVPVRRLDDLKIDVPAITFVEATAIYTLQAISPSDIESIRILKNNTYLNLNGRGVIVGLVDTGLNYLNKEFIREDDTTRIVRLWDQTIQSETKGNVYIGTEYTEEEINRAIQLSKSGGDPYSIVPSVDKIGHGTHMAGIIGARGYNKEIEGIANDCEFCVVKLMEALYMKKLLLENGIKDVPVYNNTEILAAIKYIIDVGKSLNKPIIIFIGLGTQDGSHDGNNLTSTYLTNIARIPGIAVVSGTGNLGNDESHFLGYVKNVDDSVTVEIVIPREIKHFNIYIWVQKPNRMNLNIISPQGENSGEFKSNLNSIETREFYLSNTKLSVRCRDPESLTGHGVYELSFTDIKPGIWKYILKGVFITNGRFDLWLDDKRILPEGIKFLNSTQENTLTIPSTAENIITVAHYDGSTGAILGSSGKGYNSNQVINPYLATIGTNILTTSIDGNSTDVVSGSSVATAIVAGSCALIMQWGIVDGNDLTINSLKLRSFLVYAAQREKNINYPNIDTGYGKLDLNNVFNVIGGNYLSSRSSKYNDKNNIFFRFPNLFLHFNYARLDWEELDNGK